MPPTSPAPPGTSTSYVDAREPLLACPATNDGAATRAAPKLGRKQQRRRAERQQRPEWTAEPTGVRLSSPELCPADGPALFGKRFRPAHGAPDIDKRFRPANGSADLGKRFRSREQQRAGGVRRGGCYASGGVDVHGGIRRWWRSRASPPDERSRAGEGGVL